MAQATALKLQTEARFRQVRAQVLTDVEKAFVAYRIGNDRLHLFDKQILRQASQVRDIEQVAYQEGERAKKMENPTTRGPIEAAARRYVSLAEKFEAARKTAR